MKIKKTYLISGFILIVFSIAISIYTYTYATENVHLGKYKGLTTEKIEYTVDDGDIETSLKKLAENHPNETKKKKGTVGEDEKANVSYTCTYDGKTIESASGTKTVKVSTNDLGFEKKLVGLMVGQTSEIPIAYSDTYEKNKELCGKQVVYTITVNYRIIETTPEITNEFIQKNTNCNTIEEYKEKLKDKFIEPYEKNAEEKAGNILIRKIIKKSRVKDYLEKEVKKYKKNIEAYYEDAADQMGITMKELLVYMDMSEEDYEKDLENESNFYVSKKLIVKEIAKKQMITLTDAEYNDYLENISDEYNDFNSLDDVKEYVTKNKTEDDLRADALAEKVIKYLLKHNKVKTTEKTIDYVAASVDVE